MPYFCKKLLYCKKYKHSPRNSWMSASVYRKTDERHNSSSFRAFTDTRFVGLNKGSVVFLETGLAPRDQ